ANSSTAPPDLLSWTVNVGPSTAAVAVVTTRRWGNRHARRRAHGPSLIRCGDSHLGRVLNASEPRCSSSLPTGRHLPTGWHQALIATSISQRLRFPLPVPGALCFGIDGKSRGPPR